MALSDAQRGPRAAWLYHHRVARFGRGEAALEALAEELRQRGAYRAPDTIKGWESSEERSPIPPDVLPHLEAIFGDPAPSPKVVMSTEDLVAALNAQTEALATLVSAIEQDRQARAAWETGLLSSLRELLEPAASRSSGRAAQPREEAQR